MLGPSLWSLKNSKVIRTYQRSHISLYIHIVDLRSPDSTQRAQYATALGIARCGVFHHLGRACARERSLVLGMAHTLFQWSCFPTRLFLSSLSCSPNNRTSTTGPDIWCGPQLLGRRVRGYAIVHEQAVDRRVFGSDATERQFGPGAIS